MAMAFTDANSTIGSMVYIETLRDYASEYGYDPTQLELFTVAHEVGHQFKLRHVWPGEEHSIMGYDFLFSST